MWIAKCNKLKIYFLNAYIFFPQHFLNLRPLPQMQGSLRPIFGVPRVLGVLGGQQLVSLQQDSSSLSISLVNSSLPSLIFFQLYNSIYIHYIINSSCICRSLLFLTGQLFTQKNVRNFLRWVQKKIAVLSNS